MRRLAIAARAYVEARYRRNVRALLAEQGAACPDDGEGYAPPFNVVDLRPYHEAIEAAIEESLALVREYAAATREPITEAEVDTAVITLRLGVQTGDDLLYLLGVQ